MDNAEIFRQLKIATKALTKIAHEKAYYKTAEVARKALAEMASTPADSQPMRREHVPKTTV